MRKRKIMNYHQNVVDRVIAAQILADRAGDAQETGGAGTAPEAGDTDEAAAALEAAASSIANLAARLSANGNAADKTS